MPPGFRPGRRTAAATAAGLAALVLSTGCSTLPTDSQASPSTSLTQRLYGEQMDGRPDHSLFEFELKNRVLRQQGLSEIRLEHAALQGMYLIYTVIGYPIDKKSLEAYEESMAAQVFLSNVLSQTGMRLSEDAQGNSFLLVEGLGYGTLHPSGYTLAPRHILKTLPKKEIEARFHQFYPGEGKPLTVKTPNAGPLSLYPPKILAEGRPLLHALLASEKLISLVKTGEEVDMDLAYLRFKEEAPSLPATPHPTVDYRHIRPGQVVVFMETTVPPTRALRLQVGRITALDTDVQEARDGPKTMVPLRFRPGTNPGTSGMMVYTLVDGILAKMGMIVATIPGLDEGLALPWSVIEERVKAYLKNGQTAPASKDLKTKSLSN